MYWCKLGIQFPTNSEGKILLNWDSYVECIFPTPEIKKSLCFDKYEILSIYKDTHNNHRFRYGSKEVEGLTVAFNLSSLAANCGALYISSVGSSLAQDGLELAEMLAMKMGYTMLYYSVVEEGQKSICKALKERGFIGGNSFRNKRTNNIIQLFYKEI